MIRPVLDTNVLASALLRRGSPPNRVLRAAIARDFTLVISDHIIAELLRTLARPYFRAHLSPARLVAATLQLRQTAERVVPTIEVHGVAAHAGDDAVLAAAVSGGAAYLVTGDRAFRRVRQYQGTSLVTPTEFLAVLAAQRPD